MTALTTAYARSRHGEQDPARARGQAAYVAGLVAAGHLPHLAALRPEAVVDPDDVFRDMVRRVLSGLLDAVNRFDTRDSSPGHSRCERRRSMTKRRRALRAVPQMP